MGWRWTGGKIPQRQVVGEIAGEGCTIEKPCEGGTAKILQYWVSKNKKSVNLFDRGATGMWGKPATDR